MSAALTGGADQAAALRALVSRVAPEAARPVRHPRPSASVVTIASGKGGVGKTTLAVNLSAELAKLGVGVTLLDFDLGTANADVLCGLSPNRRLDERTLARVDRLAELAVDAPGGFRLIPGAVGVPGASTLDAERRARLLRATLSLSRPGEMLVIDCAAGIGPDVTSAVSIAQLSIVVTTPEPTAMTDAYALIKCTAARRGAVTGLALAVNMANGAREADRVHTRISRVSERFLGAPIRRLGWIPRDTRVSAAVRARRPLALARRRGRPGQAIAAMARDVRGAVCVDVPTSVSRA